MVLLIGCIYFGVQAQETEQTGGQSLPRLPSTVLLSTEALILCSRTRSTA
jgi:hypothetical protein